jgi:RNA-binding protein 23/39
LAFQSSFRSPKQRKIVKPVSINKQRTSIAITLINSRHSGGGGSSKEAPVHRLYIGNIHFNLTEDDIKAVFAPFGEIEQVQLQKEHDTGRSRGYGFVQFRDPPSAREALEKLNGFELAGRAIRVGLGNDKFTTESTQAILDRYDGFRGPIQESVSRGGTERLGGGGGTRSSAANLDDTDVAGVSFERISREALMQKLARRDELKEEPVYVLSDDSTDDRATKVSFIPTPPTASRCVLLKNMFDPHEETGDNWVKDLEDDVKAECESKYGKVLPISNCKAQLV